MIPTDDENVNEIKTFDFSGLQIRAITKHGEPWFVATDVARALAYRMASDMTRFLEDEEKGTLKTHTLGGLQDTTIISEAGLYSAIIRSNKPEAKQFKKWVTSEVLPQIRKTGSYQPQKVMTEKEMVIGYLAKIEENEKLLAENNQLLKANDVLYVESQTQKQALDYQQPFVEHSQALRESKSLIATSQLAATQGIEVSAISLNKFLEKEGVLRKVNQVWILTSFFLNKGYGKMVAYQYTNSNGEQCTAEQLRWYETGRAFVLDLWKKKKLEVKQ